MYQLFDCTSVAAERFTTLLLAAIAFLMFVNLSPAAEAQSTQHSNAPLPEWDASTEQVLQWLNRNTGKTVRNLFIDYTHHTTFSTRGIDFLGASYGGGNIFVPWSAVESLNVTSTNRVYIAYRGVQANDNDSIFHLEYGNPNDISSQNATPNDISFQYATPVEGIDAWDLRFYINEVAIANGNEKITGFRDRVIGDYDIAYQQRQSREYSSGIQYGSYNETIIYLVGGAILVGIFLLFGGL